MTPAFKELTDVLPETTGQSDMCPEEGEYRLQGVGTEGLTALPEDLGRLLRGGDI